MEHKESDYVVSFDTLYTNNHIQILKVLLHHLPNEFSGEMAVFIKFMELQHAISHRNRTKGQINICSNTKKEIDVPGLLNDILFYCDESEKTKVKQLADMMQTMQTFEEMKKFTDILPGFNSGASGEGGEDSPNTGFDISSLLQNMLTPEQQAMFEMFNANNE